MSTRTFFIIFVICALVVFSRSALLQIPHDPANDAKGYCYDKEIGSLKNGQIKQLDDKCQRAICNSNRVITVQSCGTVMAGSPDCIFVPGDLRRPYPDCCDTYNC